MEAKENKKDRDYLYILFLSIGIDLLASLVETPFVIELLGTPLVIDELMEVMISNLLAKERIKLRWYDYALGMLPIPGVTAISVYAFRNLFKKNK